MSKLSQNLKTLLAREKKSASWLARESGVPRTTISSWIQNQEAVNITQLTKVAATLKISLWRLLHNLEEADPHEDQLSGDIILTDLFEGDLRVKISKIERKK